PSPRLPHRPGRQDVRGPPVAETRREGLFPDRGLQTGAGNHRRGHLLALAQLPAPRPAGRHPDGISGPLTPTPGHAVRMTGPFYSMTTFLTAGACSRATSLAHTLAARSR